MVSKQLMAALAPLLIVAMVAAPRPAEASRPSSDASGVQEAVALSGLRRIAEFVHSDDDLEHAGTGRHLLATCPTGYRMCVRQCTNLQSDADNCGACRNVCPDNNECVLGKCRPVAATAGPAVATSGPAVATATTKTIKTKCPVKTRPTTSCYYDTSCSNNNCGKCGECCPADGYCIQGKCVCPPGKCLCKANGKYTCINSGQTCKSNNALCCAADKISGVCKTKAGNVCCPTTYANTRCFGPPENRQCCTDDKWTGPTTTTCCPADKTPVQCVAFNGDKTPPKLCCDPGLECRFNQNPNPAKPSEVIGYACISQTCPPPASINPKCLEATSETTDPPCCCKKCQAPYVPACPVDANGNLDKKCGERGGSGCGCKCPPELDTGRGCCPLKKCGTTCCPNADDVCYTKAGQQACCPKSRWDNVNKVCCTARLCGTKAGNVCCGSGTKCQSVPDTPTDVKNDVCCADSLWTGPKNYQCCTGGKKPTKCVAKPGDNSPPTICCDPDIPCQYNENTDSSGKVIGYSCINQACPAPETRDPHCTELTDPIENPFCCCSKCEGNWVPQCPLVNGKFDPTCDEKNVCGCKCTSKRVCGNNCCPNATDTCDANNNCCPNGVVDGKCCEAGTKPAKCANSPQSKCCAAGEECQFSFINNAWERTCCKTGYWDVKNDKCCDTRVCNTKAGPRCCALPERCQFSGSYGQCCTNSAWTGSKCCSGDTPAASTSTCPDGSRICCALKTDICFADGDGNNACCPKERWSDQTGCCPEDRWTGFECCPEEQWNCNGYCVGPGTGIDCCVHTDCQCEVPTAARVANECPNPPCCMQYLCCDGKCIQPDDQNCGNCAIDGGSCGEGEICALNQCVPAPLI